jgi:hypothetical protein
MCCWCSPLHHAKVSLKNYEDVGVAETAAETQASPHKCYWTYFKWRQWSGQQQQQWWIKWHIRKWRSGRSRRIERVLKTVVKNVQLINIISSVNFIVISSVLKSTFMSYIPWWCLILFGVYCMWSATIPYSKPLVSDSLQGSSTQFRGQKYWCHL